MILSELHQWIHSTLITITMLGCPPCHHSAIFRNYLLAWNRSSLTESIIVITKLEIFLLTGPTDELKNDWFSQEIHLFALIGCTRTPIINIFDSRDFIEGSLTSHSHGISYNYKVQLDGFPLIGTQGFSQYKILPRCHVLVWSNYQIVQKKQNL